MPGLQDGESMKFLKLVFAAVVIWCAMWAACAVCSVFITWPSDYVYFYQWAVGDRIGFLVCYAILIFFVAVDRLGSGPEE